MKRVLFNLFILFALLSFAVVSLAQAKKKPRVVESAPTVISEANVPDSQQNRVEIFKAAEVYKTSLRQLLAAREAEAAEAGEQFVKLKGLYQDGLISRLQLENAERELTEIRHKVEETRRQLAANDSLVIESVAEKEAGSVVDFETMPKSRVALKRVVYIRNKGSVDWSASDIGKVDEFFRAKFKKALPVVAPSQSETHTRWGFDHRNAIDVSVHPDSPEGRALMRYLNNQGIPFMAFRRAVPGSATGPHIHIGKSSQNASLGAQ